MSTSECLRDLLLAARLLAPYVRHSGDPQMTTTEYFSQAEGMRRAADRVEACDAAVVRFRNALKACEGVE